MIGTPTADTTETFCPLCDRGVVVDSQGRCVLGHRVAPARPGTASQRVAARPADASDDPQVGLLRHATPGSDPAPVIAALAMPHQGSGRMTRVLRHAESRPTLTSLLGLDGSCGSALDIDAAALPLPAPFRPRDGLTTRVLTTLDDDLDDRRFARRHALTVGGTALGVAAAVGSLVGLAL
jgi:uncharacterized protein (UPF0261 family)